jgi:hypothetical protein
MLEQPCVHLVVKTTHQSAIANERVLSELLDVALQGTRLVGRGAESHP